MVIMMNPGSSRPIDGIENNTKDVRLSTIVKVFNALKAKVNMSVIFDTNTHLEIA